MKQSTIDTLFFAAATILAVLVIWYTFTSFLAFSGFAVVMAKATLGCMMLYLIDKTILRSIDSLEKLRQNPVAYAIYYFGYALIISAAVLSA